MANSSMLGLVGKGQTVRGWCLTGFNPVSTYLRNNHINGYNLVLDEVKFAASPAVTSGGQQGLSTGAIPFKFITPMSNTQYKIFCQPRSCGPLSTPLHMFTHALDTTQYPKTVNGFWVRFGYLINSASDAYASAITNRPAFGEILNRSAASNTYQLQVVVI